uniref:SMED-SMAD6/7-1 n=1 Tax=Schmidtea mediterranea TaxID=79327 RepID=I3RSU1_SCHMD|nr:SMED-SMAD6/7-1 [Schmidtea mediterranea]
MKSNSILNISQDQINQETCLGSWTNFVYKRKLIKNIIYLMKTNNKSRFLTVQDCCKNILEILSKILAKLNIQQLKIFLEIAQSIHQFQSFSPIIPCIKGCSNLFRYFDIDYIKNILWITFRSSLLSGSNEIKFMSICSNRQDCINPFHWSLMKTVESMNVDQNILYDSYFFSSIQCNLRIKETIRPTKIITPAISSLSSVFIIYYQSCPSVTTDCKPDSLWQELGICIHQLNNRFVSLYNYTTQPIFISSICKEIQDHNFNKHDPYIPVYKILPNHSVNVFSLDQIDTIKLSQTSIPILNSGIFTVQISFGKGWGRGYSRSSFLYCPCRCEISIILPDSF